MMFLLPKINEIIATENILIATKHCFRHQKRSSRVSNKMEILLLKTLTNEISILLLNPLPANTHLLPPIVLSREAECLTLCETLLWSPLFPLILSHRSIEAPLPQGRKRIPKTTGTFKEQLSLFCSWVSLWMFSILHPAYAIYFIVVRFSFSS